MKYSHILGIIATVSLVSLVFSGCGTSVTTTPNSRTQTVVRPKFGVQAKTSGCMPHNGLSDSGCTPGAIIESATQQQICQPGYSRGVRNVPTSEKNQVYAEYSISQRAPGEYEVDHLISLELGGSNDISNLWPEAASPKPGFHEKDSVENYLHSQVCSGAVSLQNAQIEIATNWLAVYQQMPTKSKP